MRYYILNYYLGCGFYPDYTRPHFFYFTARIHCIFLNWQQRNIKTIYKQKFEVSRAR
jgi:hypothetical protein